MLQLLTVKYGDNKSRGQFLASDLFLRVGDRCVIGTDRGVELGLVLNDQKIENYADSKIHKALRKATERDLYLYEKKREKEAFAFELCCRRIKVRRLSMKLSRVEYIFDESRVIFYFTAARRVDFRALVKDLARELRTRIEMRQIGARDEARILGGIGCCGLGENCSAAFLKELKSVSVRTAKAQELAINPSRLSGMCGRLKCCLNYELEDSEQIRCGNCGTPHQEEPRVND